MNYGDMKTVFSSILNRTDATANNITQAFTLGLARINRELRIPASEIILANTIAEGFTSLTVPSDLKEVIVLTVNDEVVPFLPIESFKRTANSAVGQPTCWSRAGQNIYFNPIPQANTEYELIYYGTVGDVMASDSAEPTLSAKSPDLIIYAALTYAGKMFLDDRLPEWEQTYKIYLQETQDEAFMADGGMAVQPMHTFEPYI